LFLSVFELLLLSSHITKGYQLLRHIAPKMRMLTPLFYLGFGKNVSKFTIRENFKKFLCAVLLQSVGRSVGLSVCQSVSQSVSWSAIQPASQSAGQPASQTNRQT